MLPCLSTAWTLAPRDNSSRTTWLCPWNEDVINAVVRSSVNLPFTFAPCASSTYARTSASVSASIYWRRQVSQNFPRRKAPELQLKWCLLYSKTLPSLSIIPQKWRFGVPAIALDVSTKLLYRSGPVSTGIDDHFLAGKPIPPRYITSHLGQLSLLPSAGRKMSTGQSVVMLCGWE